MVNFNDPASGFNVPGGVPAAPAAPAPSSFVPFGQQGPSRPGPLSTLGLALVAGLAGGRDPQQGMAEAGQNAQFVKAKLLADDKKAAINAWLKAGAPKDVQHPATQALFAAAPEIAQASIAHSLIPPEPTSDIQEYKFAQGQGFKGTLMDFTAQQKARAAAINPAEDDQVQSIADGIASGDIPPNKTLYHFTGPVMANLAKRGFDLTKQSMDYTATSKRLATMNGAQQIKLTQSIGQVEETLPLIESLAEKWQGGGFKPLNRLNLEAASQGAYGQEAQSIATRLQSAIADVTSELGTVYKGGNASTDESLRLAAENLKADWSAQTLLDNIKQVKQQIVYRKNSMKVLTQGTPGNRYDQPVAPEAAPAAPAQAAPQGAPPVQGAKQAPDGNWYLPDPSRPGKYLQVQP